MSTRPLAVIGAAVAIVALWTAGCSNSDFPLTPTPLANQPVTTMTGGSWSGNVMLSDGTVTTFNMTLIARSLGASSGVRLAVQAPGTVEVTGDYETGTGLTGKITGSLQGTLRDGLFQGTFLSDSPSCSRLYAGPITESSVALLPAGGVVPGCPLTFSVQTARPRGPDCHYSITADRLSFPGSGGSGVITVEAEDGCAWAAESLAPWIQVTDPAPRVGRGTIAFTVNTNGQNGRDGQLRFANPNQTITIRQGAACALSVTPSNATVPGSGGGGTVQLQGPGGCEWMAQSAVDWIAVAPATGTGPATVTFTAQGNPGLARQGTFSVGGQTVTVVQAAGCALAVTPLTATIPMGGGGGSISVAGVGGCGWTASSNVDWMTVSPAAGDGNGTVAFSVQANVGQPRQGTLSVAGQSVTITQGTCSAPVTVSVSLSGVAAAGGTGSATITAAAGCPWTSQSNVPWILLSSSGGVGSSNVTLTVQPNPGGARQGTITVAGQTFTITQDAVSCSYELRPAADLSLFPFTGGARTGTVVAPAGCAWTLTATANAEVPWLTVAPPAGTGNGTFIYAVAQNANSPNARTGTVTLVGGATTLLFAVSQIGDNIGPGVSITAPAADTNLDGDLTEVTITASATDNQGVASVQFIVDGQDLPPADTTAPYSIVWSLVNVEFAFHTLAARATDAAGNSTTSVPITISYGNFEGRVRGPR
jgi:hypothetical protein